MGTRVRATGASASRGFCSGSAEKVAGCGCGDGLGVGGLEHADEEEQPEEGEPRAPAPALDESSAELDGEGVELAEEAELPPRAAL